VAERMLSGNDSAYRQVLSAYRVVPDCTFYARVTQENPRFRSIVVAV
jgi:hypothetical protein